MSDPDFTNVLKYELSGGDFTPASGATPGIGTVYCEIPPNDNNSVNVGEVLDSNFTIFYEFIGTYTDPVTGDVYYLFEDARPTVTEYFLESFDSKPNLGDWPTSFAQSALDMTTPLLVCFAAGTGIETPRGEVAVEDLPIGDLVSTADGRAIPVKWIGRQTVVPTVRGGAGQPVRIRAGALGGGLPHSDLTVTADHGMILDGLVINASALVNGSSIDWVPMAELPRRVTYFHVETEAHDVILANGAAAETLIDHAGRSGFDNYAEYVELFGTERVLREMPAIRISSQRLVPERIKARLGLSAARGQFDAGKLARSA